MNSVERIRHYTESTEQEEDPAEAAGLLQVCLCLCLCLCAIVVWSHNYGRGPSCPQVPPLWPDRRLRLGLGLGLGLGLRL